jgi:hypothetical protein
MQATPTAFVHIGRREGAGEATTPSAPVFGNVPRGKRKYSALVTVVDRDLKDVGLPTFQVDRDSRPPLTEVEHWSVEPLDKAPHRFEVLSEKRRNHVRLHVRRKLGVEECCVSDDRSILCSAVGHRYLSFQPRTWENRELVEEISVCLHVLVAIHRRSTADKT